MDTIQFLQAVLSANGKYYCVTVKHVENKPIKEALTQTAVHSIEDLAAKAHEADRKGLDAYFALATFGEENNRKAVNVVELKALFLDIDCGPAKDYPDQVSAFRALVKFCKHYSLPKPIVVNSGNGLHIYWPLTRGVTLAEWKPVALRLKEACNSFGLICDEKVTADAARVLRVVGTHNHKREALLVERMGFEEVELTDLSMFNAKLGGLNLTPVPSFPSLPTAKDPLLAHYTKNFVSSFKKIFTSGECAQVLNRVATRAEASYDEWTEMLALAQQCEDREKAIKIVSAGHPDFDYDFALQKAATFDGPTLCSTFEKTTPGFCAGCKHQGKIKSPIIIGKEIATADEPEVKVVEGEHLPAPTEVTIPKYPRGYARGQNGGVYIVTEDEDGGKDMQLLYEHDLYLHAVVIAKSGDQAIIRSHLPHEGMREFSIPLEHLTSKEELRKHLSRKQIMIGDLNKAVYYFMSWVKQKQMELKAVVANEQFGWDEDVETFVWGDWVYRPHEEPQPNLPAQSTAAFMPYSRPKGSRERWQQIIDFYNRPGMEAYQAMMCMSLAAPLMRFTGFNLGAVHFRTTDSGRGKTTTAYAAMSFWGRPKEISMDARDTHNSHMHQMEILKNIPFVIDELTNKTGKFLSDMLYAASSGRQRSRMRQNGNELRTRGEPWHSVLITTANDSVLDVISAYKAQPDAEAQRLLEVRVPDAKGLDKAETDSLYNDIQENYGFAGPEFIQYIVDSPDEAREVVRIMQRRFDKAAQLQSKNRFWSAVVATNLAAALIANKMGLLKYDVNKLMAWWLTEIEEIKVRVEDFATGEDTSGIISRFWYDNLSHIVVLDGHEDNRGGPNNGNGLDQLVVPYISPKANLVGRYERNTNTVFISVSAIREWCMRDSNRISYSDLRSKVANELGGKVNRRKKSLAKGTMYGGGQVNVWEIPADRLDMEFPDAKSSADRADSA